MSMIWMFDGTGRRWLAPQESLFINDPEAEPGNGETVSQSPTEEPQQALQQTNVSGRAGKKKVMEFAIEVKKLECGSYMATVDWSKGDAGKVGTPGGVVYADSAGEAYEIYKGRLEAKGHTVLEEA